MTTSMDSKRVRSGYAASFENKIFTTCSRFALALLVALVMSCSHLVPLESLFTCTIVSQLDPFLHVEVECPPLEVPRAPVNPSRDSGTLENDRVTKVCVARATLGILKFELAPLLEHAPSLFLDHGGIFFLVRCVFGFNRVVITFLFLLSLMSQ